MTRRTKFLVLAVVVLGAVAGAVVAAAVFTEHESAKQERMRELRMLLKGADAPGRIEKYEQSRQAKGLEKGREASRSEIVAGPAQEDYANRAYPSTRIEFAQQQRSLRAANRLLAKKATGAWQAIGPGTLNVDTFGTQTYGVDTQWSGRVTAAAVGACSQKCTLYVGAAGGGVWMTSDALAKKPKWANISDGQIDSTSIGSILVDPTDSTHQTIYVGTGEPNGSGDSEAGIGLYRSTDGGTTWTLLTGSQAVAKDRGIGAIAVDPNNSQHLLMGTTVARHGLSSNSGGRFTPPAPPVIGLYESTNGGTTWSLAFSRPQDTVDPTTSNGSDFFRGGVTKIEYDPNDPSRYYFSMFGYGLFRHSGSGGTQRDVPPIREPEPSAPQLA